MKVKIRDYNKKHKRKSKIKFSSHDFYSLDHTLALIIAPALKLFRKHKAGIPSYILSEKHWELCGVTKKTKAQKKQWAKEEKIAEKKWNDILDAMVWSFTEIAEDNYEVLGSEAERKAYDEKLQHGLDIFAQHYHSLWT